MLESFHGKSFHLPEWEMIYTCSILNQVSSTYRIALIFRGSKFLQIAVLKEFVE